MDTDLILNDFRTEAGSAPEDDSVFMPFASFVQDLANHSLHLEDPNSGQALIVEQMTLDLPVEIRVEVDDGGKVRLKGSPPTQRTETTILPVFHQMKVRVVRDDGDQE